MLFNSLEFVCFLVLVLTLYHTALRDTSWRTKKGFLVVVSYAFYMSWNPAFGLLLLASTVLDYTLGLRIAGSDNPTQRRLYLLLSLTFNLGMLGFFKYGGFAAANIWPFVGTGDPPLRDLILPVGISFYTFESLSYTIDIYRGEEPCRDLLDFSLFLSFFPHLVAGPIVRPRQFLPQLDREPLVTGAHVEAGLARIAQGLVKKVLLADSLGLYVDRIWDTPGSQPGPNALLAIYAYAFQIYFDFSGYTDIALGVAQWWGLTLPENFRRPYQSADPREFWQRWHISLSTWLRDYLYLPLGGNRGGVARTQLNLFLTMLLGGLWHGPSWTFVIWGAFHGLWLVAHRLVIRGGRTPRTPKLLRQIVTFHLVCFGWMFFRAPSMQAMGVELLALLRWNDILLPHETVITIVLLMVGIAMHVAPPSEQARERITAWPAWVQGVVYAIVTAIVFLQSPASARFIYFQF